MHIENKGADQLSHDAAHLFYDEEQKKRNYPTVITR